MTPPIVDVANYFQVVVSTMCFFISLSCSPQKFVVFPDLQDDFLVFFTPKHVFNSNLMSIFFQMGGEQPTTSDFRTMTSLVPIG